MFSEPKWKREEITDRREIKKIADRIAHDQANTARAKATAIVKKARGKK